MTFPEKGEKTGVVRSSSMAILPTVTCSGRKLTRRTGSILKPAHCASVGRNVPGGALVASMDSLAIGLTSFGTMTKQSTTSTADTATIASCRHREKERRGGAVVRSAIPAGKAGPVVAGPVEAASPASPRIGLV